MFKIFRKLHDYLNDHKLGYVLVFIGIGIMGVLQIITPWAIGEITDAIQSGQSQLNYYLPILVLAIITSCLAYGVNFLLTKFIYDNCFLITNLIRKRLMRRLTKHFLPFFNKYTSAELITRLNNDAVDVEAFTGFGIMNLAYASVYVLVVLAFIVWQVGWIGVVFVAPLFLIYPVICLITSKERHAFMEVQNSYDQLNKEVYESIEGVRLVRAYRMEQHFNTRFAKAVENVYHKTFKISVILNLWGPLVEIHHLFAFAILILVGAHYVQSGSMTVGQLIAINMYITYIMWPISFFGEYVSLLEPANAAMERINKVMDDQTGLLLHEAKALCPQTNGDIEIKDLNFTYPKMQEPSLQHISFKLEAGKTLGIVGMTGSGKTTLIEALLRLWEIPDQQIFYAGQDINNYEADSYYANFGYVPQSYLLFSRTIRENLLFAKPDASEAELWEALEFADLAKDVTGFKEGLNTVIGEKGVTLSGGQKQRLSLARAFLAPAKILILDDSLSAVDSKTEQNILRNLASYKKDVTKIIAAHRLSAVMAADLIIVLEQGEITELGTHQELMAKAGYYARIFQIQATEQLESPEAGATNESLK